MRKRTDDRRAVSTDEGLSGIASRQSPVACRLSPVLLLLTLALGCSEIRGRKLVQEGNELYKRGKYADAVARFAEAEAFVPELPALWLNKGYTCRQLVAPGARDPESKKAVACALGAFERLHALRPKDERADALTVQTLFDADDFPRLEALFLDRNKQAPEDVGVVLGLQQVYYKWGKWRQALDWSKRAAALRASDAEAQYRVGTFVWQVLSSKGGGPEMAGYDPRPHPPATEAEIQAAAADVKAKKMKGGSKTRGDAAAADAVLVPPPPPPPTAASDITGAERAALADEGIAFLEKALALRPRYPEAMTYLGLVHRQRSFAFFADPPAWQAAVDRSNEWQKKAQESRGGKT